MPDKIPPLNYIQFSALLVDNGFSFNQVLYGRASTSPNFHLFMDVNYI